MARLSETRYKGFINSNVPSTGKFVPLKFKMDIYPHSEFERLGRTNGSYFKAFNIEPYPYERDRVSLRMSDEDRARRAKWMKDQDLAKDEPRTHKSLMDKIIPKNAIRRLVRTPANMLEGLLANAVGPFYASNLRVFTTRVIRLYVVGVALTYWLKYNTKSWEKRKGGFFFLGDGTMGLEEVGYQKSSDFADYGFKNRKVLKQEN